MSRPSSPGTGASNDDVTTTDSAALSVSELTRRVTASLAGLGPVVVEGELGPPKRAASGHVYFELKDAGAVVSCVVWRSSVATAIPPGLEAGALVRVHGRLDVYAPRGSYSLVARRIERSGVGELLVRFEKLKRELAARGWFDRKRPLPAIPQCIGVVTSRDGAALRDVLRTRTLRWPGFPMRLCHTPVQGPGAAESIGRAISDLAASGVDLVVVTRGGGSIEDLWSFNEEVVARAIFECPVPVVSAVGHETDTTLSDLVADHRAHTPTDAAVLVVPDRAALVARLERGFAHLSRSIEDALEQRGDALRRARRSGALTRPERLIERGSDRLERTFAKFELAGARVLERAGSKLDDLGDRLATRSPLDRVRRRTERVAGLFARISRAAEARLGSAEKRVAVGAATLSAVSPLRVLARGYSVTQTDGRTLFDAADVEVGATLVTRLARGSVESRVTTCERTPTSDRDDAPR